MRALCIKTSDISDQYKVIEYSTITFISATTCDMMINAIIVEIKSHGDKWGNDAWRKLPIAHMRHEMTSGRHALMKES